MSIFMLTFKFSFFSFIIISWKSINLIENICSSLLSLYKEILKVSELCSRFSNLPSKNSSALTSIITNYFWVTNMEIPDKVKASFSIKG